MALRPQIVYLASCYKTRNGNENGMKGMSGKLIIYSYDGFILATYVLVACIAMVTYSYKVAT